jgi:hypothetical protein
MAALHKNVNFRFRSPCQHLLIQERMNLSLFSVELLSYL